ncbi:Na+/H+ antiporter [Clostridium aminobutyricum]|uniref:Na+/H+ antiporter n=1 Tax=Clostridium aminobutyricum TaxID=33953 RepID=A0A939IGM4_CLOAM|nr:Na+/H+ antiporter [Clostridium aminobutyricum]MBN7773545.1 Na+/H+ antiporter [Clostridium aminobutyricum]
MLIFEYILILLVAVLLSNLINRFIPALSVPIIQIVLGILIALIPFGAFGFEFELEPELFFVLFLSPLVFHSSMTADKKALWEMKKPILGAAVALVFITVIVEGYFIYTLIPAIPLAAAFALSASLAPTDVVAVNAVSKRVSIPGKLMGILSGESIINDATGLVCFQLALTAAATGSFSIANAVGRFLLLGIGGIIIGLLMTWLKYAFVRWLRLLGMENSTLHILIGVMTPFIIYMGAEALHVSGILAAFSAGIAHSFMRDRFNPDKVSLNIAHESVWSVLSFSFDGLVFVMLGTQLPGILKTIGSGEYAIDGWQTAGCILLITLCTMLIRFVWCTFAVQKQTYQEEGKSIGRMKAGIIFSLSGARGTVTLASIMSIPLLLSDGNAFPQRGLMILLASGVIVVSLLITNFILPLFTGKKKDATRNEEEQTAYLEILQTVVARLKGEATDETRMATELVTRNYYSRGLTLDKALCLNGKAEEAEKALRRDILMWEKENTEQLLNEEIIDKRTADRYLTMLETRISSATKEKHSISYSLIWIFKHMLWFKIIKDEGTRKNTLLKMTKSNGQFVLEKLKALKTADADPALDRLISEYEMITNLRDNRMAQDEEKGDKASREELILKITARGFGIERELIQQMFEAGRISWETAKELRSNMAMLEAQLQIE